jgi:hypothetical protein
MASTFEKMPKDRISKLLFQYKAKGKIPKTLFIYLQHVLFI